MKMKSVDVCIPTCKRPQELLKLLESIRDSECTELIANVIVVDNSPDDNIRSLVLGFNKDQMDINYLYVPEPRRGIVFARNRLLESSHSEYISFIDDDEYVAKNWLRELMFVASKMNADVVFGRVELLFPEDVPNWLSHLHGQQRPDECAEVTWGSTANVLIKRSILDHDFPVIFDHRFNTTGGEDTEFFYRLSSLGYRFFYSSKGIVFEPVVRGRLSIRWYLVRNFRVGQTNAAVFGAKDNQKKYFSIFKKLLLIFGGGPLAIIVAPFRPIVSLKLILSVVRAFGYVSYYTNVKFDEYGKV